MAEAVKRAISLVEFDLVIITVKDENGNGAVHFTGALVLASIHHPASLSDVSVDLDAIQDDVVSSIDDELLGVEEGLTSGLKLLNISFTDRGTVLHDQTNLADELAKLEDAISDSHV